MPNLLYFDIQFFGRESGKLRGFVLNHYIPDDEKKGDGF